MGRPFKFIEHCIGLVGDLNALGFIDPFGFRLGGLFAAAGRDKYKD
jgi:hypothetical protein